MDTPQTYLLLCYLLAFACYTSHSWRIFHNGRAKGGFLGAPRSLHYDNDTSDLWFSQKLDHFDPTNTAIWNQRYFVNANFYKNGGPVFLMIGGEGKANPIWMNQGMWINYAQQFNALCFQLEHRFYGKSHPTNDLSVKNLVYLSSEQALADIAYFIEEMNEEYKLGGNIMWVAFGGSYPGSLAAWARLKYPHLIRAAVSTSGPLLAIEDFSAYMDVVKNALQGHSASCAKAVALADMQIEILLSTKQGHKYLESHFQLCDSLDNASDLDMSNLFETLAGNVAGIVQYNKDNREFEGAKDANITIDTVCSIMSNDSMRNPIDRYAEFNSLLLNVYDQKCLDYKYNTMINNYQNVSWDATTSEGGRQWMYQTCTEFGFFQTSPWKSKPFKHNFLVDFFIQQCSDIFGPRYNKTLLEAGIARTNNMYGAMNIKVDRVVFVHGSIDPWHVLGITKSLGPDAPAIYIKETAHCANMYPESPTDPPQLIAARQSITGLLAQWLQPSTSGHFIV